MIDVEQTIISQYGNSATITQLIQNMNEYIDPRADFDTFFDFVWNVETARGFGLDIWGQIVDIDRQLQIDYTTWFGFTEGMAYPFDQAPFFTTPGSTSTFTLADDAYRKLILTKALGNISSTTAQTVNQLLQNMFADRGRCYVNDLGSMRLRYTFEFALEPYELAVMTRSGALPRPAGVSAILITVETPAFGFVEAGASAAPFDQAPFITQGAINEAI